MNNLTLNNNDQTLINYIAHEKNITPEQALSLAIEMLNDKIIETDRSSWDGTRQYY